MNNNFEVRNYDVKICELLTQHIEIEKSEDYTRVQANLPIIQRLLLADELKNKVFPIYIEGEPSFMDYLMFAILYKMEKKGLPLDIPFSHVVATDIMNDITKS